MDDWLVWVAEAKPRAHHFDIVCAEGFRWMAGLMHGWLLGSGWDGYLKGAAAAAGAAAGAVGVWIWSAVWLVSLSLGWSVVLFGWSVGRLVAWLVGSVLWLGERRACGLKSQLKCRVARMGVAGGYNLITAITTQTAKY